MSQIILAMRPTTTLGGRGGHRDARGRSAVPVRDRAMIEVLWAMPDGAAVSSLPNYIAHRGPGEWSIRFLYGRS